MSKNDTRGMTIHVPISMTDGNTHADERDQLTQEALVHVDAGQVVNHQAVLAWANSLDSDQPLTVPS